MTFQSENFIESLKNAVPYIPVCLKLIFISFALSLIIGTVIAAIRAYKIPVLSQILSVVVTVYMGLPIMVALVIYNLLFMTTYDQIAQILHLSKNISEVDPIIVGYIALTLSTTCIASENIRGAFHAIEQVQFEAGYSIGLTKMQTLVRIILPQMVPVVIPGLINLLVGTIKGSNLVSAVGIIEIMAGALIPCARTYSYLEGYLAAAVIYWILTIVVEQAAKQLEKHSGRFRRQIV